MIKTDHKSIRELFQQVIQTPEQQAYVRKLMGFNFRIDYRPGKTNTAADALSRVYEDQPWIQSLTAANVPVPEFLECLREENSTLSDLVQLKHQWEKGDLSSDFYFRNGLLFFKNRYYISSSSKLIPELLQEAHATPIGGHGGMKRTLVSLASKFF